MNPEYNLSQMTTSQLMSLQRTVGELLKVTKESDLVPIYVAALHGLRTELESRQIRPSLN